MTTTVLILSILISVGGKLLIDYGDVVGKEEDMMHMSDVEGSLVKLRGSMLSLLEAEDTNTRIINRFTLGTPGNAYLAVARSSGVLRMDPCPAGFQISVHKEAGGSRSLIDSVSGSIVYTARNYYFNERVYLFEGGGILMEEYSFLAMSSTPSVMLREMEDGESALSLNLYGMTGNEWTMTGIDTIVMTVTMDSYAYTTMDLEDGEDIVIRTIGVGLQGWADYLRSFLGSHGFTEGSGFTVTEPADWSDTTLPLEVTITGLESLSLRTGIMEVTL